MMNILYGPDLYVIVNNEIYRTTTIAIQTIDKNHNIQRYKNNIRISKNALFIKMCIII